MCLFKALHLGLFTYLISHITCNRKWIHWINQYHSFNLLILENLVLIIRAFNCYHYSDFCLVLTCNCLKLTYWFYSWNATRAGSVKCHISTCSHGLHSMEFCSLVRISLAWVPKQVLLFQFWGYGHFLIHVFVIYLNFLRLVVFNFLTYWLYPSWSIIQHVYWNCSYFSFYSSCIFSPFPIPLALESGNALSTYILVLVLSNFLCKERFLVVTICQDERYRLLKHLHE